MTRTYAATRLLALGPLTLREFHHYTGWPESEARKVLDELRAEKVVKAINRGNQEEDGRLYALAEPS